MIYKTVYSTFYPRQTTNKQKKKKQYSHDINYQHLFLW